jgi:hypothetical protein
MLDVHPPHHAPSTWRDFFLHIVTITIGLLIALALEAGAEAIHHHHLVLEARENIRHELEQNRKDAAKDLVSIATDEASMKANLVIVRTLLSDPKAFDGKTLRLDFDWSGGSQSAWISARDSGALLYMPTAEVQRYADVYDQQNIVNHEAVDLFTHQSDLAAPMVSYTNGNLAIPPAEKHSLLHDIAIVALRLETLRQLTEPLDKQYTDTLSK